MTWPTVCTAGVAEARVVYVSGARFIYDAEVYGAREEGRFSLFRNGVSSRTGYPSAKQLAHFVYGCCSAGYSKAGEAECMLLDDIPTMNMVPWLLEESRVAQGILLRSYVKSVRPQRTTAAKRFGTRRAWDPDIVSLFTPSSRRADLISLGNERTSRSSTAHRSHKHGQILRGKESLCIQSHSVATT